MGGSVQEAFQRNKVRWGQVEDMLLLLWGSELMFYFSEDGTLSLLKVMSRDMAPWVKCLPQKHEDRSSDPKHPRKTGNLALPWSPCSGAGVDECRSRAYPRGVTADLAKMSRSRFRERELVLKGREP